MQSDSAFSFKNRLSRGGYLWYGVILTTLILIITAFLSYLAEEYADRSVGYVIFSAGFVIGTWINIAALVKRFRDIGHNVWLIVPFFLLLAVLSVFQQRTTGLLQGIFWVLQLAIIGYVIFKRGKSISDAAQ
jgi:uncharacterized membrane protein YhaH (DUF805 family)